MEYVPTQSVGTSWETFMEYWSTGVLEKTRNAVGSYAFGFPLLHYSITPVLRVDDIN